MTDESVLETVGSRKESCLQVLIKKRKLSYFGHVMWKSGGCLEKEIVQGTVPGLRAQARLTMK